MEENNSQIKIKLTTVIVLILLVLIIIFGVLLVIFNKNNESKSNQIDEGNSTQSEYQPTDIKNDTKTNYSDTEFSFKFLKIENNRKNMIYSPLSIKYALEMLNEGASGNTKIEIEKVIKEFNLTKYSNVNDVLSLANGLYIRDRYSSFVKNEYKNTLQNKYNAEIKYDAFENASNVNKWIENKTLGIIKNMIDDSIVQDPNTEMLLINALAIDMEWENQFEGSKTYGEKFNLNNGNTMTATMMHNETSSDNISFYKDKNVTSLTMDLKKYDNTQLEFIAIMPNKDLSEYVRDFTINELNNITKDSKSASKTKYGVDISIPKFSFDYDLSLKDDLINIGIKEAFDENLADFSNMTNSPIGLYVSEALHKANIDFTEKGVKAAAATVIVMTDKAMIANQTKPEEIKIDKPFMYIIRDKQNGEIWFVGTVYEPNSWESDKADYQYR